MGSKKKNAKTAHENLQPQWMPNGSITARNIPSKGLNGVIFGCTHHTIQECLDKQLFGLPASHFSYVRNIIPGMALFLFNYSDRKLHGIFEAKSSGQMRIDPYAWSSDGSEPSQYPAQVRVQYRSRCLPLIEEQFKPIIGKNYYIDKHFWFELDHKQTQALINLFSSMPVTQNYVWKPQMKNNPSMKTLPPRELVNNGNLRASSNFHVLVSDDLSSGDETIEATGNSHSEIVQLCEGPSSATDMSRSNALPLVEEYEVDVSTSEAASSWNELGWVEDGPVVTEGVGCFQGQESGLEAASSQNNKCVEWKQIPTSMSTGEKCMLETAIDQCGKGTAVMKPKLEFQGPSISKPDSSNSMKAPTKSGFPTAVSEHAYESTILRKIHTKTQAQAAKEGAHSKLSGISTQQQHALVGCGTSGKVVAEELIPFVGVKSEMQLSDQNFILLKLAQELENLKATQILQTWKVNSLERELGESKEEVRLLRQKYEMLESIPQPSRECSAKSSCPLTNETIATSNESVFLVGGCDGESWLSSLNLYAPLSDMITSLKPMETARSYAPAAKLNGEIYVLGGVDNETTSCYDTVASYNLSKDQWTTRPSLKQPKGNLAATSVNGKIFAIGGGSGLDCFSEVEMFDDNAGMWFQTRSMRNKRFAPAAVEIDGIIYVVGGYNGKNYLKSAERFDHREHSWTPLESMSTARGCHSLAALNGKIYALGGYDGSQMVSTVEVFDPRNGKWTTGKEMNIARGYAGAVALGESIYIMGGMKDHVEVLDTVECYKDGKGWHMMNLKGIGKRCFFSAIEM